MGQYRHYLKLRSSRSYQLFLYGLITAIVMFTHQFLPQKRETIYPAPNTLHYIYGDNNSRGLGMATWLDYEHLTWQCAIEDDGKSHSCGFNLVLTSHQRPHGIDLSGFSELQLELAYEGPASRLRIYTRGYVENISKPNDTGSDKFMNVIMPIDYVNQSLRIGFDELAVAEWWITDYKVPRSEMRSSFDQVTSVGIDLNYPTAPGNHRFALKRLEFVGDWVSKEHWYLAILCFWMIAAFILGVKNLIQLRLEHLREKARLNELLQKNSVLEDESNHYRKLSMLDQLTGLLNRHGLSHYIEKHFSKENHENVSLAIIDIDFFKKINDVYGHDGGDRVLVKIAQMIKNFADAEDFTGRWGGEEFVVIMKGQSLNYAQDWCERLRVELACSRFEGMESLAVTISIGVGSLQPGEAFHNMFRRVDKALYRAKAQGRNRVLVAE